MKGRTTWYESVSEMQDDLDAYIETYNRNRPHRGRGMEARTPYQIFKNRTCTLGEATCQVSTVLATQNLRALIELFTFPLFVARSVY